VQGKQVFLMYGESISRDEIRLIEDQEIIEGAVVSLFHNYIKAFAMIGKNLIIDHVIIESKWLSECIALLHDTNTYFIGVRCPLDELERRERERGDRPLGLARAQFETVHNHSEYDLEVDTKENSSTACAAIIKDFIEANKPRAFKEHIIESTGGA